MPETTEPGIFEIMYSTRAMRRLKPDPIPEETLKKIVDAGIRCASGGNMQDWAFIIVQDPERKTFHMDEAAALLLACTRDHYPPIASLGNERASKVVIYGSIFPAVQNILLACRALGVGATLTTIHCLFEDKLKEKLNIPDDMEVAALIPMGYPQGNFGPVKRNPVEEVIHWDEWGNTKV